VLIVNALISNVYLSYFVPSFLPSSVCHPRFLALPLAADSFSATRFRAFGSSSPIVACASLSLFKPLQIHASRFVHQIYPPEVAFFRHVLMHVIAANVIKSIDRSNCALSLFFFLSLCCRPSFYPIFSILRPRDSLLSPLLLFSLRIYDNVIERCYFNLAF